MTRTGTKTTVVHLAHFYWPHVGGVEKHLEQVATELQKTGIATTILTEQYASNLAKSEEKNAVTIFRIPVDTATKLLHKITIWRGMWQHRSVLFVADIIHVHDVFWWLLPLLPLLIYKRKKIFMTFHGYQGTELPLKWHRRWRQIATFFTRGNLCIGGFHQRWYGIQPTMVSFGAVTTHPRKTVKVREKIAVFVGRVAADNGICKYLQALKILQDKNDSWHLDVYGDGPELEKAIQYVKKHGLSVTFHGFVVQADQHFPDYQVAFVSRYLAIIEALSGGTPVIAQYHNLLTKEYLQKTPFAKWISVVESPKEIVKKLQKVLAVPLVATKWARQQTWQNMANKYLTLWGILE